MLSVVQRGSKLVDKVRKLQQAKETGRELFRAMDLSIILKEMIEDVMALHQDKEVEINYTPTETPIYADDLVRDLFSNLLDNAVKYDPSDKVIIDIDVEDANGNWKIGIRDRGGGIPDEMKELIFDRFLRIDEDMRGHGLGLYLVRVLTDKYNGKVWIEDRVKGDHTQGSVFYVILPKG